MALINRARAKSCLFGATAAIVAVTFGCGPPAAKKKDDLKLGDDEAESKVKKKGDDETDPEPSSQNGGTIELGSGTRGTEDPKNGEGSGGNSKPAPTVCTGDAQCNQAGRICTSGACVKGCRTTPSCGTNQVCDKNLCVSSTPNVECYLDWDCELGTICSANDRCIPGCYDADDCVKGQACVSGFCKVTTTGGTSSSGGTTTPQCTSDGMCNPGNDGAGKICSPQGACIAGCRRDLHCPGTKICDKGTCR